MMPVSPLESRSIRVFLSSTFRDMQAERDALVKLFNRLAAVAARRDVSVSVVDLRWGVTEDAARNGQVVSICLQEIDNSRPFFIGIVGDRYGWCPSRDELQACGDIVSRFPDLLSYADRQLSVTEMEMRYGVLDRDGDGFADALFFIKEDIKWENERHRNLGSAIDASPVYCDTYCDADELVAKVEARFMEMLDGLFPDEPLSLVGCIMLANKAAMRRLREVYIPSHTDFDYLSRFLDSNGSHLAVVGEVGRGKAALIANFIATESVGDYIVFPYFVNTADGDSDVACDNLCAMISDHLHLKRIDTDGHVRELSEMLRRAAQDYPHILIVLIGLDHLTNTDDRLLNWLPALPDGVKLIVTAGADDIRKAAGLHGFDLYVLPALDRSRRVELLNRYLARVGKKLDERIIRRIADDKLCSSPLILRSLLSDLIVYGDHEHLGSLVDGYLSCIGDCAFFDYALARAELFYGRDIVRDVLSLIVLSEHGLQEEELRTILGLGQLEWSTFYCGYASYFIETGGFIRIGNPYLSEAIYERYMYGKKGFETEMRRRITSYFSDKNNTVRGGCELAYQYYKLDEYDALHATLLSLPLFEHLFKYDRCAIGRYWRTVIAHGYSIRDYLSLPGLDTWFYNQIGVLATESLDDNESAIVFIEKAYELSLAETGRKPGYTTSLMNNLGELSRMTGKLDKALNFLVDTLEIYSDAGPEYLGEYALCLNNIGCIYDESENEADRRQALKYFRDALKYQLKFSSKDDQAVALYYLNIGKNILEGGEPRQALVFLEKGLKISLKMSGKYHLDTMNLYGSMARAMYELGRYAEAESYFASARESCAGVLGFYSRMNMFYAEEQASALIALEKFNKAMGAATAACEIAVALHEERSEDAAYAIELKGEAYEGLNSLGMACDCYREAYEIYIEIYGPESDSAGECITKLADSLRAQGRFDEAATTYLEAIAATPKVNDNDEKLAWLYTSLSIVCSELGRWSDELRFQLEALPLMQRACGEHINTETMFNNLGYICRSQGDRSGARRYYTLALDLCRRLGGDNGARIAKYTKALKNLN